MKKILESLFRKRKERSIEWMQAHLDELTENEIKDMTEIGRCGNLLIENIKKLNDAFPPFGKTMKMLNDTSEIKDKVRMLKCLIPILKTNIEIAKRTGRLPGVEDVFSQNIIVYESMLDTYNVLLSQQIQDESNIPLLDVASKKGGFTTSQQVLFFYYLFNEIGINFGNSDRAQWIRLIHSFTGKNEQDIKEKLNFKFEDKKIKQDLRIVAEHLKELMPSIAIKIKNDNKE